MEETQHELPDVIPESPRVSYPSLSFLDVPKAPTQSSKQTVSWRSNTSWYSSQPPRDQKLNASLYLCWTQLYLLWNQNWCRWECPDSRCAGWVLVPRCPWCSPQVTGHSQERWKLDTRVPSWHWGASFPDHPEDKTLPLGPQAGERWFWWNTCGVRVKRNRTECLGTSIIIISSFKSIMNILNSQTLKNYA